MTTPLKGDEKLPLYSTNLTTSLSILSISVFYVQLVKQNCVCIRGSCEGCPVCVGIPELYIWALTAAWYATKWCLTSQDTSIGLFGTFQAPQIGEWYTRKNFQEKFYYISHTFFFFRWEFSFNLPFALLFLSKNNKQHAICLIDHIEWFEVGLRVQFHPRKYLKPYFDTK